MHLIHVFHMLLFTRLGHDSGRRCHLLCVTVQAQAFALAIGEAYGPECNCEVATRLSAQEMATIIAEASASSLAEVCVGAAPPPLPRSPLQAICLCHNTIRSVLTLCLQSYVLLWTRQRVTSRRRRRRGKHC